MCVQPETCVPRRVASRTSMGFVPQDLHLGEEIPDKVTLPEAEQDTAWCKGPGGPAHTQKMPRGAGSGSNKNSVNTDASSSCPSTLRCPALPPTTTPRTARRKG